MLKSVRFVSLATESVLLRKAHCLHPNMGRMARVLQLSKSSPGQESWANLVQIACESLVNGSVIAVPTDTIYGVAGLAQHKGAISSIYDIKQRDTSKPIAICVGDLDEIYKWGQVTTSAALLQELLPGPVTVVFERTSSLNPELNPTTHLVGIRVPDYGFIRDVVRHSGQPLALTSANKSNAPSTVDVQEFQELWSQLDIVFDGGVLGASEHERKGSTVVDLSVKGCFKIIRDGSAYRQTVDTLIKHGLTETKINCKH